MKIIYHALFVDKVDVLKDMFPPIHSNIFYHHSTIEFSPKDSSNIEIGKKYKVAIIGRITTDQIDALLVENPKSKNRYPHITLSTAAGVKPFKSNEAFEQNSLLIERFNTPSYIDVTEGYFDGQNDIK